MKTYKVTIYRRELLANTFTVKANSKDHASEVAMDESSDYEWGSDDYVDGTEEVTDISEVDNAMSPNT